VRRPELVVEESPAVLTLGDLAHLPPTVDGQTAAAVLGCSYWCLLELAKRGEAPVAPLHLGRHLRWPTLPLLRAVGAEQFATASSPEAVPQVVPLREVGNSGRRRAP
jgi:hypothetical protein